MAKYEVNYFDNNNRYTGEEVEVNDLTGLCNEILRIAYQKKPSSIAEVVELDG